MAVAKKAPAKPAKAPMKYTAASDAKADKKAGIKPGSAADRKLDAKRGVKK